MNQRSAHQQRAHKVSVATQVQCTSKLEDLNSTHNTATALASRQSVMPEGKKKWGG